MAEVSQSIFEMDPSGTIETDDFPQESHAAEAQEPPTRETAAPPDEFAAELPEDLPPALAERWEEERKKHQRNYAKQLDRIRKENGGLRQKAELVDRFYNDPAYAAQTIRTMAQQLGYTLTPAQRGAGTAPADAGRSGGFDGQTGQTGAIPAEILHAAQAAVADDPDLAFLAPAIAKAAYVVAQQAVKPLHEEADQRRTADAERYRQERAAEFARMTAELEEDGVDWREHEDEMLERLAFLQNAITGKGGWTHPKYGNFLRFLHGWTVGPRAAQAEAGKRLQKALQTRTTAGTPTRSQGPNTEQLIREAKTPTEQWKIAFQQALAEVPLRR